MSDSLVLACPRETQGIPCTKSVSRPLSLVRKTPPFQMSPSSTIVVFLFAFLLFLSAPALAQEGQDSSRIENADRIISSAPGPDPPPTLISEEPVEIEITANDPELDEAGFSKTFRYGALADGPVLVEADESALSWIIQVKDGEGALLARATSRQIGPTGQHI